MHNAAMEAPPKEKKLRTVPFAAHATRGLIRDRGMRRKVIFVLLLSSIAMAVAGSTFLREMLDPREHLGWFAMFWLLCGWITITTLLLALFDLIAVRAEARGERRALREETAQSFSDRSID